MYCFLYIILYIIFVCCVCLNLQYYVGDQVHVHVQIGKVHLLIKMQKSTKVMAGTGKPFLLTFLPMEVGCCPG